MPANAPASPSPNSASAPTAITVAIPPTPTLKPLSLDERKKVFEQVWANGRDKYVYADFRGLDWQKVRDEFVPKVAATSPESLYTLIRVLIKRLGNNASYFMDSQEVAQDNQ